MQAIASLFISPVWTDPMVFGIMVLVLMVRPQGLFGRLGHALMRRLHASPRSAPAHEAVVRCAAGLGIRCGRRSLFAADRRARWRHLLPAACDRGADLRRPRALSVDILLGYAGLLSLGQALYFGLGAYISALMYSRRRPVVLAGDGSP